MGSIFEAATAVDGVSPINESGELVVQELRPGHIIASDVAEAVVDLRDGTIMLAVHPDHRRLGHGRELLQRVLSEHPTLDVWAFGTLPGAEALAHAVGLAPNRVLLRMTRPLCHVASEAVPVEISPFQPDDADAIVAINAQAFAHHPEQGKLTRAEFDDLRSQPWFSPDGLLVARDRDAPIGFHWTKRHGNGLGEVYVIAVAPGHEGKGIGRALLAAGLQHLFDVGDHTVELYVEAAEERVVRMYEAAGFSIAARDTRFGRAV
ncbi:mycothiol synthase [uncultured Tessaracoccus sp.]|uniref:mycothiol synthase n=1 Tax=uncultured Tessaracoccus sp. TaxID=905023 RepID=UPI0026366242|nr:mycothiol synthase [uncultured Tessaracoccus sp.]